jgi:hypothetical protein
MTSRSTTKSPVSCSPSCYCFWLRKGYERAIWKLVLWKIQIETAAVEWIIQVQPAKRTHTFSANATNGQLVDL